MQRVACLACGLVWGLSIVAGAASGSEDIVAANEAELARILPDGAKVERLATGFRFTEGPVWMKEQGGYLLFSDIPANQIRKWTAAHGVSVFRDGSRNTNGNTRDLEGRLVSCEHTSRTVTRTGRDGKVETLVDSFEGKKLNSPNDVVVRSDGAIYFTDPDYGLPRGQQKEQPGNIVYRFDPKSKAITALVRDFDKPNGLAFSPDEKKLYVADSGMHRHIRVFDVKEDGTLDLPGKVFCKIDTGGPDGIRSDDAGRVWSSAGDGVHVFAPDGKLLGKIPVPEGPANLCFGGEAAHLGGAAAGVLLIRKAQWLERLAWLGNRAPPF